MTATVMAVTSRLLPPIDPNHLKFLLALGVVVLSIWDLSTLGELRSPRRQTQVSFRRYLSLNWSCIAWGFDVGLGVTTFRVTRLFWAVLAIAVLLPSPWPFSLVFTYELSLLTTMVWRSRRLTPLALIEEPMALKRSQVVASLVAVTVSGFLLLLGAA